MFLALPSVNDEMLNTAKQRDKQLDKQWLNMAVSPVTGFIGRCSASSVNATRSMFIAIHRDIDFQPWNNPSLFPTWVVFLPVFCRCLMFPAVKEGTFRFSKVESTSCDPAASAFEKQMFWSKITFAPDSKQLSGLLAGFVFFWNDFFGGIFWLFYCMYFGYGDYWNLWNTFHIFQFLRILISDMLSSRLPLPPFGLFDVPW